MSALMDFVRLTTCWPKRRSAVSLNCRLTKNPAATRFAPWTGRRAAAAERGLTCQEEPDGAHAGVSSVVVGPRGRAWLLPRCLQCLGLRNLSRKLSASPTAIYRSRSLLPCESVGG